VYLREGDPMYLTLNLRKLKNILFPLTVLFLVLILLWNIFSYIYPLKYMDIIRQDTAQYDIDPSLVCAVIHAESKFSESARSHKGASGLMQLTEGTADWIADQMDLSGYSYDNIFDPKLNIELGCRYLYWLLNRYKDVDVAVAAYNAGNGNVDKWLQNPNYSSDGLHLNTIPYKETREYVSRVEFNKHVYDIILLFGGK
jgi:soluble lytic murein transglycosylase